MVCCVLFVVCVGLQVFGGLMTWCYCMLLFVMVCSRFLLFVLFSFFPLCVVVCCLMDSLVVVVVCCLCVVCVSCCCFMLLYIA